MTVLFPRSIDEAVSALADPDVEVLAGGTDFMVEVNGGRRRPAKVLSLRRVLELRTWQRLDSTGVPRPGVTSPGGDNTGVPSPGGPSPGGPSTAAPSTGGDGTGRGGPGPGPGFAPPVVRLGATVTYTDLLRPALARLLPALAQAARTVGSPQIRNAGTIGGNLATASPAGDTLPVLSALEAVVEVAGSYGVRDIPLAEFITGPKRNALNPGELIVAVRVPLLRGHQEFRKVGVRNAMVIAVASLALVVDPTTRTVRCALGSVGPGPVRAYEAEAWLTAAIDWDRLPGGGTTGGLDLARFARLVGEAARPIDDHRSTAAYRRHAVTVLAQRAAAQALATNAAA